MTNRLSYAYVVSTPFSGSTLLALLLNAHSEVASIGEVDNPIGRFLRSGRIDQYLCSCGARMDHCPFWLGVQRRCARQGLELDLNDFGTELDAGLGDRVNWLLFGASGNLLDLQLALGHLLRLLPGYRRRKDGAVERSLILAWAVLGEARKKVFVDASKNAGRAALLARQTELDWRLIHLVRDPRGVVNSYRKHRGHVAAHKVARYWNRVHQSACRLKARLPADRYLLVQYERLATDPEETVEDICRFLGVRAVDLVSAARVQPHHLIGNEMRMQPFTGLRLDEAWRSELPPSAAAHCMATTHNLISRLGLGYE